MRQSRTYNKDLLAWLPTENDAGYEYYYLPEYLSSETAKSINLKLQLSLERFDGFEDY